MIKYKSEKLKLKYPTNFKSRPNAKKFYRGNDPAKSQWQVVMDKNKCGKRGKYHFIIYIYISYIRERRQKKRGTKE